jgi:S1-C subfamily serine protease
VEGGILVRKIKTGGPFSKTRMQDGFIITSVNDVQVTNIEELSRAIASLRSGSMNLEGFYDGYDGMYRYPVNLQLEDE